MTLCIRAKVLLHVWLYDFYDMTLSTEKQRRRMINGIPACLEKLTGMNKGFKQICERCPENRHEILNYLKF